MSVPRPSIRLLPTSSLSFSSFLHREKAWKASETFAWKFVVVVVVVVALQKLIFYVLFEETWRCCEPIAASSTTRSLFATNFRLWAPSFALFALFCCCFQLCPRLFSSSSSSSSTASSSSSSFCSVILKKEKKMIRNHAQSGSGRSLCLGRRRTRARVWTTSLLIQWVWWLRNKKRICRENRKMQKSITSLSILHFCFSLSLSLSVARARSLVSPLKKNEEEEKDGWFSIPTPRSPEVSIRP